MKADAERNAGAHVLDAVEQARYLELATWAENTDIAPNARITKTDGPGAGQSLLEAALSSADAVKRAVGKPSLSGKGSSPSRTIRLSADMDAQLIARAAHEQRKPSAVLRDALAQYLSNA